MSRISPSSRESAVPGDTHAWVPIRQVHEKADAVIQYHCFILVTLHSSVSGVDELNKLTTSPRIIKTHLQVQFIPKSFWEQKSKVYHYITITSKCKSGDIYTPMLLQYFPMISLWLQIIYVARNAKDTAVSYFHFDRMNMAQPEPGDWSSFLQRFIEGKSQL